MLTFLFIILTFSLLYAIIKTIFKQKKNKKLYLKVRDISSMFSDLIRNVQNGIITDPEIIASEILKKVNYSENSKQVPIIDIANQMGFFVKSMNELPNNDSGFIIISPELGEQFGSNKGIIISEKIKYEKSRFVIAHEIGHYLFDFNERTNLEFSHVFVEHYNKESQEELNEKRVNLFAACLLMPDKIFIKKFNALKEDENLSFADIISSLSNIFAVTPKTVEVRMTELELRMV